MKILLLDIETAPNLAHVWDIWNQNISTNQIMEASYTLCLGYKWYGEKKVSVVRRDDVARVAYDILDEADMVVTYNGNSFDIPVLQKDILLASQGVPSPFKSVDLYRVVKKQFKFTSHKLGYVAEQLGLQGKVKHPGHSMWVGCINGDEKSWKDMERYNKRDVVLLEELYDRLIPWIPSHPNVLLYNGADSECTRCGSGRQLIRRGYAYTLAGTYQRFSCGDCGSWSRGTKRVDGTDVISI